MPALPGGGRECLVCRSPQPRAPLRPPTGSFTARNTCVSGNTHQPGARTPLSLSLCPCLSVPVCLSQSLSCMQRSPALILTIDLSPKHVPSSQPWGHWNMTFHDLPTQKVQIPKEGLQPRDQVSSAERTGHAGCARGACRRWGSSGLPPLQRRSLGHGVTPIPPWNLPTSLFSARPSRMSGLKGAGQKGPLGGSQTLPWELPAE